MTSDAMSPRKSEKTAERQLSPEQAAAAAMVTEARQRGLELTTGYRRQLGKNLRVRHTVELFDEIAAPHRSRHLAWHIFGTRIPFYQDSQRPMGTAPGVQRARGRSPISSTTFSVIRERVSREAVAP